MGADRARARPAAWSVGRRRVLVAHPSAELYGSDRVMLETVQGLVEHGWQVLVTLPADGALVGQILDRGAKVVFCASPVLRKSALRPWGFSRLLADCVRGLMAGLSLLGRARPDVVYVNTVTVPLWLLLARLSGIPTVCHVHEAESSASRLLRTVLACPLFLADTIIANSEFSRGVIGEVVTSLARRTTVIYNGVVGPPASAAARERLEGPLRLVYVGRLSERKGVDVAVSAVAELLARGTSAELDIVGAVFAGYEWYEARLVEQIARLGLRAHVRLLGFESPVWPRLAAADIALVPSRWDEPFGNSAVEAVLAGRPTIASDSSGLREAVAGFSSVLAVAPGDPLAIADAAESMAAKWSDYRSLAGQDAALAATHFAPARYRTQMVSAISRTLAS